MLPSPRLKLPLEMGLLSVLFLMSCVGSGSAQPVWDNFSDTWVAADDLGRCLPTANETGPPRTDRTVGIFYFLWLGEHARGGPYDITRILATDPAAMQNPDSPLWGPLHVPHHWGESIFGYYRTRDESVLRKHAQMLSDAGVDVVIFDVSNQVTYRDDYLTLLRVWSAVRAEGNRTPAVAFLTPFWDPPKVVRELYRDLYAPGLYRDLWFQWEGRPLILADPEMLDARGDFAKQDTAAELSRGHSLGQSFATDKPFLAVGGRFPTWNTADASVTLSLYRHRDGPGPDAGDPPLLTQRFANVADNAWLMLRLTNALPAGRYHLEASDAQGKIGWWTHSHDSQPAGHALIDRRPTPGDRTLRLAYADAEADALRKFFTFRKPQPDYFRGPTQSNMWSWLEVYPQHVFRNERGEKEQMSVGVAQNAVNGRLGSMSEPGAFGRSRRHNATDLPPDAVRHGYNFAEQAQRALQEDPRFVFITGWNEWIAGRFAEFNGVRLPVMFVDQFDQEHSRDIEPMRGGHGDNYYYQMAAFIRRYKGSRPLAPVSSGSIRIDGSFTDWESVSPEFRDTIGDPVQRHAPGWDTNVVYRNDSGRNDIVAGKISFDEKGVAFYVRTRATLTSSSGSNWMVLLVDADGNPTNGWMGYDVVINRRQAGSLERHAGGDSRSGNRFAWRDVGKVEWRSHGRELELRVGREEFGLASTAGSVDFKWCDNVTLNGDWSDFTLNGDSAPNDRFNFRAVPGAAKTQ